MPWIFYIPARIVPNGKCAVMGYKPDSLSKITFKVEQVA